MFCTAVVKPFILSSLAQNSVFYLQKKPIKITNLMIWAQIELNHKSIKKKKKRKQKSKKKDLKFVTKPAIYFNQVQISMQNEKT